jgi:acyl carrier protein
MTEDENEIRSAVREVVAEILELQPDEFADDSHFEDIGADSVQRLEVVIRLRRKFGAHYSLEEEAAINSVSDAVRITQLNTAL